MQGAILSKSLNLGVSNHLPREAQPFDYQETKHPEANVSILKAFLALFCVGQHPLLSGFIAISLLEPVAVVSQHGCHARPATFRAALPGGDSTDLACAKSAERVKPTLTRRWQQKYAKLPSLKSFYLSKEVDTSPAGELQPFVGSLSETPEAFQVLANRRDTRASHAHPPNHKDVGKGLWEMGDPAENPYKILHLEVSQAGRHFSWRCLGFSTFKASF